MMNPLSSVDGDAVPACPTCGATLEYDRTRIESPDGVHGTRIDTFSCPHDCAYEAWRVDASNCERIWMPPKPLPPEKQA